jgi:hypothetical protein
VPVLISPSRKSFLRTLTGRETATAGPATLAAEIFAAWQGADYIRTHDVAAIRDALTILAAITQAGRQRPGTKRDTAGRKAGVAQKRPIWALSTDPPACPTLSDGQAQGERTPTRRYLQPGLGCIRCSRRGCFMWVFLRGGALSEQCLRGRPGTDLLVAASFRT